MSFKRSEKVDRTQGSSGYYWVSGEVMGNQGLTLYAKLVFSYILSLWSSCKSVHPSTDKIMEMTGSSRRSVIRARQELVQLGLITELSRGNGRGNSTEYRVNASRVNEFFGADLCKKQSSKCDSPTDDEFYEKFRNKNKV